MIQWLVLLGGLILITIPVAIVRLGGISKIVQSLPDGHLSFTNIESATFINWMIAIVPI